MRSILTRLHTLARQSLPQLPRHAIIGAWFFAIVSAIPLIWLMIEGQGSDGRSQIFGTTVNSVVHTVWGLTYAGFFGNILLWLEFVALMAAIVITALPHDFKLHRFELTTKMRRIGLSYLTGWAGLWMIGTMYLASINPGFWIVQAAFIAAMFGCTVYRTMWEWNGDQSSAAHPEVSPAVPAPSAPIGELVASPLTDIADISRFMIHRSAVRHSDRVRERDLDGSTLAFSKVHSQGSTQPTSLEDDYGNELRQVTKRAAQFAGQGLTAGLNWVKRSAKTVMSTLHHAARTTRSA